jgi:uncharacterized membrane protein YidH (DUF202 family)
LPTSIAAPPRPAPAPGRALTGLTVLALALVAAFVFAPAALSGDRWNGGVRDAFRAAFVGYWNSGDRDLTPDLQRVVDYWFRYHIAKGTIAAILLVVLAALSLRLWKAFIRAGAGRGAALAVGGAVATLLTVVSLTAVMANAQGVVAPFSSLMPMLTGSDTEAVDQIRQRLVAGEKTPPPIDVMIRDFGLYHAAMAVIAALVGVVLIGLCVVAWKRFRAAESRRAKRVLASAGLLAVVLVLAAGVLLVANVGVAADPAPALLAFFEGGW